MKELRKLLIGKKFRRVSPITKVAVEGEVKDINYRINTHGGNTITISFFVLSTNGIPYDFYEIEFIPGNVQQMMNEIFFDLVTRIPAKL